MNWMAQRKAAHLNKTARPANGTLGECLMLYRIHHGISLIPMSRIIGISKSCLSRIENGSEADQQSLLKAINWLLAKERPSAGGGLHGKA